MDRPYTREEFEIADESLSQFSYRQWLLGQVLLGYVANSRMTESLPHHPPMNDLRKLVMLVDSAIEILAKAPRD